MLRKCSRTISAAEKGRTKSQSCQMDKEKIRREENIFKLQKEY